MLLLTFQCTPSTCQRFVSPIHLLLSVPHFSLYIFHYLSVYDVYFVMAFLVFLYRSIFSLFCKLCGCEICYFTRWEENYVGGGGGDFKA